MTMLARFIRRLFLSVCLLTAAWGAGYGWFVLQVPQTRSHDNRTTDAIVVLTGGKGRIDYGISLLASNKAKRLFISGVGEEATPQTLVEQSISNAERNMKLAPDAVIILGYNATSTIGNALEVAQWMHKEHLQSLRLVTANYHMPRSLEEFRLAMPEVTLIPDPVILEQFHPEQWWNLHGSGKIMLSEYHKLIAAKIRHVLLEWSEDEHTLVTPPSAGGLLHDPFFRLCEAEQKEFSPYFTCEQCI